MKKISYTLLVAFIFLIAFMGCSKKQAAKNDNSQQQKNSMATESTSNMNAETDSLAAKRYPIRNKSNPFVTMVTDYGNMTLELYRDVAPVTVDSFLARTKDGFYNGTIFHRIIDNFMIQGGDPKGTGMGNAGYFLKAEFSDLPHQEGTLSMARAGDPNSASCQFFICLARNSATKSLDKKYTIFGQLIKGFDVLHKIGSVKCVANPYNPREVSKPEKDVYLRKVYVSDANGNELK